MSEMERQLRGLMGVAVGDPPHRVNAEAVRRRAVRRRVTSVLTATAFLLVGGLGAIVSARAAGLGGGSSPAGGSGVPAGIPRYYVEQGIVGPGHPETVVRERATGKVTASVRCPWPSTHAFLFSVAAAADRTFFAICAKLSGQEAYGAVTASRIYRFTVTASGHVSGYSLVPGGVFKAQRAGAIAATPDGREIAVTVTPGNARGNPAPSIVVINTRTGAHAVWQGTSDAPGTIRLSVGRLSLTRDGSELVFLTQPRCINGKNAPPCKVTGGEEVRALAPAARGGTVASSRILLRQGRIMNLSRDFINDVVVTPDGSTLTLAIVGSGRRISSGRVWIAQYSAATGKRTGVVFLMRTGNGFSYRCFASDPSGRHFIFDAGPTSGAVNGWINHGRLVRLKPAGDNVDFEVW